MSKLVHLSLTPLVVACVGCSGLMPSVTCAGIRSLKVGMTEDQVRAAVGDPRAAGLALVPPTPEMWTVWLYDHNRFPGILRKAMSIEFKRGRLSSVNVGTRQMLGAYRDLYHLDATVTFEADEFDEEICSEKAGR